MIDKLPIVAHNYWKAESSELLKAVDTVVEEAYTKGFMQGVRKARAPAEQIEPMKHDSLGEWCPYCGMPLKQYEGLKICYCKFCGGLIKR